MRQRWLRRAGAVAGATALGLLAATGPASAAPSQLVGNLISYTPTTTGAQFLLAGYNGTTPLNLAGWSFSVTEGGSDGTDRTLQTQDPAPAGTTSIDQYVDLALDVSGSMQPQQMDDLRSAAIQFVQTAGKNTFIGLWRIGSQPKQLSKPTQDHGALIDEIRQEITSSNDNTALYATAERAATEMGTTYRGGTVLLMTDGVDDDGTQKPAAQKAQELATARAALQASKAKMLGIFLSDPTKSVPENKANATQLGNLIGTQSVSSVGESSGLTTAFRSSGDVTQRVLLTATYPGLSAGHTISQNTVIQGRTPDGQTVYFNYGSQDDQGNRTYAIVYGTLTAAEPAVSQNQTGPQVVRTDTRFAGITTPVLIGALVLLFIALAVLVATSTGALNAAANSQTQVLRRLSVYTLSGREPRQVSVREQTTRLGDSALTRGAVGLMGRVAKNRDFETVLDARLEAAGLPIRTAEWLVLHVAAVIGFVVVFLLLAHGSFVGAIIGFFLGVAAPLMFLSVRRSRRESAFLAQLPDTLQLLAGSLQAGYSLPQAMDSVVREAQPPISLEFNRALIETRLGMAAEDALDGIGLRTSSRDFSWIVMAIRIQRDVGGNLAELLSTVAETLRERERLRRQVKALSAEGRLSGIILGALPLVFTVYLLLVQPTYIDTLFTDPIGVLLLIMGGVLLAVGAVWMSRVVKVKV